MRIVDSYSINDGGIIFSVELAEDRFVDVKVCKGNPDGNVYVMDNSDGSTVYTGEWGVDGTVPGYAYDEKAVVKLVKDACRIRQSSVVEVLEDAAQRSSESKAECLAGTRPKEDDFRTKN